MRQDTHQQLADNKLDSMPPNTELIELNGDSTDEELAASSSAAEAPIDKHEVDVVQSSELTELHARNGSPGKDQQTPSSPNEVDLGNLSRAERKAMCEGYFQLQTLPIEHIARPPECELYGPFFANEIQSAYLRCSTFVFKVWANYDACEKRFYTDVRYKDCGKLVLTPKSRGYLESVMADKALFRNVRFDIGTPFRVLARVTIEIRPTTLDGGPKIDTFIADHTHHEHGRFMKFIAGRCAKIHNNENDFSAGKNGFVWEDLCELAGMFAGWPNEYEQRRRSSYLYDGPFTTVFTTAPWYTD
ncbi:hypothetical protein LTR08_005827 [Meristemomyces frigidus]|nr:hypothetical protein LTR08_005827 [Meristemomyces frigidus]